MGPTVDSKSSDGIVVAGSGDSAGRGDGADTAGAARGDEADKALPAEIVGAEKSSDEAVVFIVAATDEETVRDVAPAQTVIWASAVGCTPESPVGKAAKLVLPEPTGFQ